MNELLTKKKDFEDSIRESEKQIEALKVSIAFKKKHLKLIEQEIELTNKVVKVAIVDADKPEAKTLGKEQASGNKV